MPAESELVPLVVTAEMAEPVSFNFGTVALDALLAGQVARHEGRRSEVSRLTIPPSPQSLGMSSASISRHGPFLARSHGRGSRTFTGRHQCASMPCSAPRRSGALTSVLDRISRIASRAIGRSSVSLFGSALAILIGSSTCFAA